jgi:hypothetical protein
MRWAAPSQLLLVHCGRLSVEKRADRSIDALAALLASADVALAPGPHELRQIHRNSR